MSNKYIKNSEDRLDVIIITIIILFMVYLISICMKIENLEYYEPKHFPYELLAVETQQMEFEVTKILKEQGKSNLYIIEMNNDEFIVSEDDFINKFGVDNNAITTDIYRLHIARNKGFWKFLFKENIVVARYSIFNDKNFTEKEINEIINEIVLFSNKQVSANIDNTTLEEILKGRFNEFHSIFKYIE